MSEPGPVARGRYHHGDLRAALIAGGRELLAEAGLAGFSVAAIARRLGVSTAAPYRHFPDRDHLLAAVATRVATELLGVLDAAVATAGPDPLEQLTACAGAYVDFVSARRVGFDVVFAPSLRALGDRDLAAAGRGVMQALLVPSRELEPDPVLALRLVEQVIALATGYAALDADRFLSADRLTDATTPSRARDAARALVRGRLQTGAAPSE